MRNGCLELGQGHTEPKHRRITAALADVRSRFVGVLAGHGFVAHAAAAMEHRDEFQNLMVFDLSSK